MRKRTLYSLLVAFGLVAALGVALLLRLHAPPEVTRLLPESDAIVYLNVKPIRAATHFDRKPVPLSAAYARFVGATGFRFDRDLDRIAFALHRMPDPNGPNGSVAYSEVMEGRFNGSQLTAYLRANSAAEESYNGHTIYTIPLEGRTLRITSLGYAMVAASNMPTTEQIHSIIDRYVASASPFSGSSLLSARYRDVPYFSLAWGIGHVGLPFSDRGNIQVFGVTLPLREDTDFIASATYNGKVHLRVDELAPDATEAASSAQSLSTITNLIRGFMLGGGSPQQAALHQAFESVKVEQRGSRVAVTADLPPSLFGSY